MYYKHNDYELIYLIREGVEFAFDELVKKYSYLLYKTYYSKYRFTSKRDFMQEGLMILNKALNTYDENRSISFFTYFMICLKRKMIKIFPNEFLLQDSCKPELIKDGSARSLSSYIIFKELALENIKMVEIFDYCLLRGVPLKTYCRIFNLSYEKTYYEYKKIIDKLRKKVD